jgi:hypothetical protein
MSSKAPKTWDSEISGNSAIDWAMVVYQRRRV